MMNIATTETNQESRHIPHQVACEWTDIQTTSNSVAIPTATTTIVAVAVDALGRDLPCGINTMVVSSMTALRQFVTTTSTVWVSNSIISIVVFKIT